MATIP
ncbi:hypothetical protein CP8484711_1565, partial [Chlamydia psittaci 84-8471/1]